jgi:hypothetical protein
LDDRYSIIFRRFLKIWKYPEIEIENGTKNNEINIFDADSPRNKKLEFAIFRDQKIELREVSKLYLEVIKQLFELHPELFFTTDLGEKISLTKTPYDQNPRQAIAINETYFIEGNLDNNSKFEKIKYALELFDLEDDLIIKYADD